MKNLPFFGSGVALVTPFTNDNKLDFECLEQLINMHIKHKTDAIVVCGTTGEASTLSDDEQEALIDFSVKCADGKIPIIAGAGSNNTEALIKKAKRAESVGADAILSVTPFYNKANSDGIGEHYKSLCNAVSLPIIVYNVPQRTGMAVSVKDLKNLYKIENIVGIKEASGDVSFVSKIRYEMPEIGVYSGNDDICVPIMSLGGVGVISVCANIFPEEMHQICALMSMGNVLEAQKLQVGISKVIEALFCEVNPIPVKNAMRALGYHVGKTRLPLGKMNEEKYKNMMQVLYDYGAKKLN